MRVYHFLPSKHALDDIEKRRIKLSEIDELNDPFELWCAAQEDRRIRKWLRGFKEQMGQRFGILCFSKHWHNPVLWSHYSERHRGICLGFEVDEECLKPVRYVTERTPISFPPTSELAQQLLFTKYHDWKYEEEWRGWFSLDERDSTGLYFYGFNDKVQLCEVIAGPLREETKATLEAALRHQQDHIHLIKARLAFRTFRVVENLRGFRQ